MFIAALRNLQKNTKASDKVRKSAAGALWILENREEQDQDQDQVESDKTGLYLLDYYW